MSLNALVDSLKDSFFALSGSCCKTDATLKLNGRSFTVQKLLGEGGFSYVYLAQDQTSGRLFALKKIRCPLGSESVKAALKEVEAYKRFRHPNIIRCLDSVVVQDPEGEGKVIYLFLPYYKNGTVQNIIEQNALTGSLFPEQQMLSIFLGTCQAVRAMHQHKSGPSGSSGVTSSGSKRRGPKMNGSSYPPASGGGGEGSGPSAGETEDSDDDEEESHGLRSGGEGDALIGGLESARAQLAEEEGEAPGGFGEEEGATVLGKVGDGKAATGGRLQEGEQMAGGLTPWAHRDIKPANIMLSDSTPPVPILMDFGSALPARIEVPDRRVALLQQDIAAEHCSMPFRAPELFDVKTGTPLTESVDIWSLGCTLFAMAYGTSPFETAQQSEHGGSIAMAALGGKYAFPDAGAPGGGRYSEGFREVVRRCLKVKVKERADIDEVIQLTEQALARLQ